MAYEHKDNSGSIFSNDKGDNPKRPDYTGTAKINGIVMRIASWVQESSNGEKYLSLKFEDKEDREDANFPAAESPPAQKKQDDLPF